jgi:pyruvate dehydrogenase E2 component (dihydrolipoamide acetyltransferase)
MPIEVRMPALSPTMTEGNLAKWLKKEGDAVHAGDVLAEIETDKATMEMEAVDEGTLGRILVPEGTQNVKVNAPIALILGEDEDAGALAAKPAVKAPAPAPAPSPSPQPSPQRGEGERAETTLSPPGRGLGEAAAHPAATSGNGHAGRIFVSPLARRLAAEKGVDLASIQGSGPHGRIIRADIEGARAGAPSAPRPSQPAPRPAGAPAPVAAGGYDKDQIAALAGNIAYTAEPITAMRRVIAQRLTQSEAAPHFYLTIECEIDRLLAMRAEANAAAGEKLSVNDFVIKAAALALKQVPEANASWSEDAILHWNGIDISVAVSLEHGLITPIIKNADKKGLAQISAEMRDLAARARAGKLKLEEFQGGTFSISNLGMFDIKEFTAVINPPQSAILAVGAGAARPVVKNGALAIATLMSCTLTCDHRVLDGATGARWMQSFKKIIEAPALLAL